MEKTNIAAVIVVTLAVILMDISRADVRPQIAWSTVFSVPHTSELVTVVKFSKTEHDMVYIAGYGHAISMSSDPNGNYYDGFPYTTILPSPDKLAPLDRHEGIFVAKMNFRTNELEFLTFVKSYPYSMKDVTDMGFDQSGNIYLVGSTYHYDGSVSTLDAFSGFDGCRSGGPTYPDWDGVIVKLNPEATQILRSCVWGFSGDDTIQGIAVLPDGQFVIVGDTTSSDFKVVNGLQSALSGGRDGYYAHFGNDGSLLAASYIGGSAEEILLDITLTGSGRLLASGATQSSDFPITAGAYQANTNGAIDSVILELDSGVQGSWVSVVYATYFGGSGNESAQGIVEDGYGDVYIVGTSNSQDYPSVGLAANTPTMVPGLVVTKFNAQMSHVLFSTFEGHSTMNYWTGEAIAVSDEGDIVVTGIIENIGFFPWHNRLLELDDPIYSNYNFWYAGYLFKWLNSSSGYSRDYTTLLGGGGYGTSVDIRSPGEVLVGGLTSSDPFVDKTYLTIPESILGELGSGPYAMVVTNDIPPRQLPPKSIGGNSTGGGGGGGAISFWFFALLAVGIVGRGKWGRTELPPV